MKRIFALVLALCLLTGCGGASAQTEPTTLPTTLPATEPPTEPTTAPTTEPPPVYTNPLNGEILEEPFDGRIYAVTVSHIPEALPHVGVIGADVVMEMYVNHSIVRCLALYTQPEKAETIGSVRSTRLMFNDIVEHYDAVMFHAGGSGQVLADAAERGIENFNIDSTEVQSAGAGFRDDYRKRYIGWEHCLVAAGPGLRNFIEGRGLDVTTEPDRDYGLRFVEDGTPTEGEDAHNITIKLVYGRSSKQTMLEYLPEENAYHFGGIFYERKIMHKDQVTEAPETFRNVVVMNAEISLNGIYHQADFIRGGSGYYACGGKIIPIIWTCDGEDQPFRFWHMDGSELAFGQGNTYIAIASYDSQVTWSGSEESVG